MRYYTLSIDDWRFLSELGPEDERFITIQEDIIKNGDADEILSLARFVKGVDLERLAEAMVNTQRIFEIEEFIKIKGVNIKKVEDRMLEIGNVEKIRKLAQSKMFDCKRLLMEAEKIQKAKSLLKLTQITDDVKKENAEAEQKAKRNEGQIF